MKNMETQYEYQEEYNQRFAMFLQFIKLTIDLEEDPIVSLEARQRMREVFRKRNPWMDFFYQTPVTDISFESYLKWQQK